MNFFTQKLSQLKNKNLSDANNTNTKPTEVTNPLVEIVRFSLFALLLVVPIRMFIAQPFIVSGASMEETFSSGEYLIVDQASYHFRTPVRGEVIVFRYPLNPTKFFIKRVIALPEETIKIANNTVTIYNQDQPDGFVLAEPYVKAMTKKMTLNKTLSSEEYFVMGDNRDHSSDSRIWGTLPADKIVGRAFLRLFPPQSFTYLPGKNNEISIISPN